MHKLAWMLSLKVGDVVNDCRYRNQRIVAIKELRVNKFDPYPLHSLLPSVMSDRLLKHIERWSGKLFGRVVFDKTLDFEDGSSCSAMNCCDDPAEIEKEM